MGQGESQSTTPRAAHWRCRATASLALLATTALGCRDSGVEPQHDLPPLTQGWHGSVNAPGPDAWATTQPWLQPAPGPATPYAVTPYPDVVASATAGNFAPSPAETDQIAATPAATDYASPASASLLAPESIPADEPTPAPGDVLVVDQMPTLAAPSPAVIAAAGRPLPFPSELVQLTSPPVRPSTPITPTPNVAAAPAAPQPANAATAEAASPPMQPATSPTGVVVNQRAAAKIRRGYELADRGAYFAARSEFLAALSMIAEAKDQIHGAPRRTIALAEGLRALDEAADFSPAAVAGAGDLAMSVIVASHQTPAAKELDVDEMLPQQLADAYFRYAETQLASAVAGEPSGSMALHALGKLSSQLGRVEPERNPQADARAFALQQAALLARPDNHLAAHELGVLLAESGHLIESDQLLRQVATRAPHAVVFRNLARVERQLGRPDLAQASERQAEFLASRGADASSVTWVAAAALARTPDPMGAGAAPMNAAAPAMRPGVNQPVPSVARGPAPYQR